MKPADIQQLAGGSIGLARILLDCASEADDVAERLGALLKVFQLFRRKRELEAARLIALGFGDDGNEAAGVGNVERPKGCAEQAVQRGIGAETDRERQNGGRREPLVPGKKAEKTLSTGGEEHSS